MWSINQIKIFVLSFILIGVPTYSKDVLQLYDICHYATKHNYPCEVYTVLTADGYILSAVRIPYSPHGIRQEVYPFKPIVYFMHGLTCSSDCWLIQGPNDGLPFMLADAGYDVWMGNARGNVHSKRHILYTPENPKFWEFDWHEIGYYDIPATIDFILAITQQSSLHYVGHSQGTTVFIVFLSTRPDYSVKIKTSHLMGTAAFLDHSELQFGIFLKNAYRHFGELTKTFPPREVAPRNFLMEFFFPRICSFGTEFMNLCRKVLSLMGIWSDNMNEDWLINFLSVYPSGCSQRQVTHLLQELNSKHFRQFDFGKEKNIEIYNNETPPDYHLELINTTQPIDIYYSESDTIATVIDIFRLVRKMTNGQAQLNRVYAHKFTHTDFILAKNVKEVVYNCIVNKMQMYENRQDVYKNACVHLITSIYGKASSNETQLKNFNFSEYVKNIY